MENTSPNIELIDDEIEHQQQNKKYVLVLLAIFVLFLIGIGLYTLGLFSGDEKLEKETAIEMNVTKPKPSELEEKKFEIGNQHHQNNPEESAKAYESLTGNQPKEKLSTNEYLNKADFEEVEQPRQRSHYKAAPKSIENQKLQAKIQLTEMENKQLMRDDKPLFRQTREEAKEARAEAKDREINQRQADLVLSQLEKANASQNSTENPFVETESNIEELPSNRKKKLKNNTDLTPPLGRSDVSAGGPMSGKIAPIANQNSTGKFWSKGGEFYSLNSTNSKQSFSTKKGILAVIHGDAEGITISSGQEVKIRLLEPLRIFESKESLQIPTGTLISAEAKIGLERLFLGVNSIYFNDQMHEVNISIYDIDGREGLNVPSLLDAKNQNKMLTNVAQPISGGNFFVPSGSVANQVGSSIAMNLGQNAIQGVSNYIRKKAKTTKVHIRSNYKILLFNQKNANQKQENEENTDQ
jgi:conjugative transposon TraM protein